MGQSVKMSEVAAIIKRLRKPDARAVNYVTKSMEAGAKKIYDESQKLVPIDTGALAASGHIVTVHAGFDSSVEVIYGGEDAYYAVFVHEDPTKAHGFVFNELHADEIASGKTHARRPQEQFKFLEVPARDVTAIKTAMRTVVI